MDLSRVKSNNVIITNPDIVKYFREDLNFGIYLEYFTHGSHKILNWTCPTCLKTDILSIYAKITRKYNCLYCDKILPSEKYNLFTEYFNICKEWSSKNKKSPTKYLPSSNKQKIWECIKKHEWSARISDRTKNNSGCPYCQGKLATNEYNLLTENFEICKEWSSKNKKSPTKYLPSSGEEVLWECLKYHHEWFAIISNRTKNNTGCPYCSGRLPSKEYNLFIINPELCKEWSSKNKLLPTEYTPSSHKSVIWECLKCFYEWNATINSRNSNQSGCPKCAKINNSKGEIFTEEYLNKNNIKYKPQKKFKELGNLSYDFYLSSIKLLIEYDGIQHFNSERQFGKKDVFEIQLIRDFKKTLYAKHKGYNLLRIPYIYLNKINIVLNYYFSLENPKQIYCYGDKEKDIPIFIKRIYKYHENIIFSTQIPEIISYIRNMKNCELCYNSDIECYKCQKLYVLELVVKDLDKLKIKYELKKSVHGLIFDFYILEKNLLIDIGYRHTLVENISDKNDNLSYNQNKVSIKYGYKLLRVNYYNAYFIRDVLNKYYSLENKLSIPRAPPETNVMSDI